MKPNGHAEATPLAGTIPVTVDIDDRALIAPRSRRRRDAETFTAMVTGCKVHVGITALNGKPVKVKIDVHKVGAPFRSAMRTIGELASLSLKDRPLQDVVDALCDGDEPLTEVFDHDTKVTRARSIPDFAGRLLATVWPHLASVEDRR